MFLEGFVCTIFFIEIIFFNHFHYFFKVIWLLIIPMLFKYIFYSITTNIELNLESLNDVLICKVILKKDILNTDSIFQSGDVTINQAYTMMQEHSNDNQEELILYNFLKPEIIKKTPNTQNQKSILNYAVEHMNFFFKMKNYLKSYEALKKKPQLILNIYKAIVNSL